MKGHQMTIDVKYYPNEEAVTVQFGFWEHGEFIYETCNHAGAYEDRIIHTSWDVQREDIDEWSETIIVCDKCEEEVEL